MCGEAMLTCTQVCPPFNGLERCDGGHGVLAGTTLPTVHGAGSVSIVGVAEFLETHGRLAGIESASTGKPI